MKKITYTKNDIIQKIKSDNDISLDESKIMVEIVLDSIKQYLLKPDKNFRIEIRNFGVFEVKPTKARDKARNPKTLKLYRVPARRKLIFKAGKINEARKLVCSQARPEECEEIYRWLYDNLEIITKEDELQDKAVLIIKQGLVDHSFVADPEINLASVMIKLARLHNAK